MTGLYPDVPAPRIAYDRGGVTALRLAVDTASVAGELSQNEIQIINDESDSQIRIGTYGGSSGNVGNIGWVCIIFPEGHDLRGVYIGGMEAPGSGSGVFRVGAVEISTDSTNGVDGTWVEVPNYPTPYESAHVKNDPAAREDIHSFVADGIRAIRCLIQIRSTGGLTKAADLRSFHVYGWKSTPTDDSLRFWHPTLDKPLDDDSENSVGEPTNGAWFDYGDVPRESTVGRDKTFRIKNNSSTLTASGIDLFVETLVDASPSLLTQFELSVDGGEFSNPNTLPDLGPGQISPPITLRRSTPSDAELGLWWPRIVAEAASWE